MTYARGSSNTAPPGEANPEARREPDVCFGGTHVLPVRGGFEVAHNDGRIAAGEFGCAGVG